MRVQGPPRLSSKFEASIGYSKMREEGRRGKNRKRGKEGVHKGGREGKSLEHPRRLLSNFNGIKVMKAPFYGKRSVSHKKFHSHHTAKSLIIKE